MAPRMTTNTSKQTRVFLSIPAIVNQLSTSLRSGFRSGASAPSPVKSCRVNRSMQHLVTTCSDTTSFRESTSTVVLNQNLNRAFVLFELTPGNEIGLPGSYKKTLSKCCNDPLRPPRLSESGPAPTTPGFLTRPRCQVVVESLERVGSLVRPCGISIKRSTANENWNDVRRKSPKET